MPKIKAADPGAVVRDMLERAESLTPAELVRLFGVTVTWDGESACLNLQI